MDNKYKQRFGNDAYVGVVIAYILWERMEDFKNGQAMEGGQVVEWSINKILHQILIGLQ